MLPIITECDALLHSAEKRKAAQFFVSVGF
jgi:hypothetical protein